MMWVKTFGYIKYSHLNTFFQSEKNLQDYRKVFKRQQVFPKGGGETNRINNNNNKKHHNILTYSGYELALPAYSGPHSMALFLQVGNTSLLSIGTSTRVNNYETENYKLLLTSQVYEFLYICFLSQR